jgi:ribosomal-protein-alanine N-acetyltransferase
MIVTESARLRLRHLEETDAAFVLELLTDPDFLSNIGDRGVHDLESALRYIATGPRASYARFGFGLFLMERKRDTQPLGLCGLLRRDTHPDVEIGFALLPGARGQGYAIEAARATMQFGTQALGLSRIVAITAPDNVTSIRVLEGVGLKFERMVYFTTDGRPSRLFVFDLAAPGAPLLA